MPLAHTTLRPGLLVSLRMSINGNVQYKRLTIDPGTLSEDGEYRKQWETECTISDPAELTAAKKARATAAKLVRGVCAYSAFGLLCPEAKAPELEAAIAAARQVAAEFNATATLSRFSLYIMTGRIAPDDVEAVKSINKEIRDLLFMMEQGVSNLEPTTIRAAANRARSLGQMLSPEASERIQGAVEAARSAAKKIVKAGEEAAVEVDRAAVRIITEARTAFLDLDPVGEVAAPAAEARAVDLTPAEAPTEAPRRAVRRRRPAGGTAEAEVPASVEAAATSEAPETEEVTPVLRTRRRKPVQLDMEV